MVGPRRIRIADAQGRHATVLMQPCGRRSRPDYREPSGGSIRALRVIKHTRATSYESLRQGDNDDDEFARTLIEGDPEIERESVGRATGPCDRVYLDAGGEPCYGPSFVEARFGPDGTEIKRRPWRPRPANLLPERPRWSGLLEPRAQAARRYAFTRAYQLLHVDGLSYEFLFKLACYLDACDALVVVGSGRRGDGPLILERGGLPYRGLLEGRTQNDRYLLVLHLAAFELQPPEDVP